jgi:SulP family sulfate permease
MRVLSSLLREFRRVAGYFATDRVSLVPFLREIRKYRLVYFKADLRASMNVSLLAIPQSIAYASIAGLPIVYGILGAAVAGVIAPLFSGSQHTVLGPTNATAFMMLRFWGRFSELLIYCNMFREVCWWGIFLVRRF